MSSELRFVKWVRFFERNCIVKWVIFFASFCWLWDFLLENLKLKKNSGDVYWNVWTNIKTLYARNNIFKKRIPNMRFLNHLYFGPSFVFQGTILGGFSQCFFQFFVMGQPWWSTFLSPFPSPATIKKLPTALYLLCSYTFWFACLMPDIHIGDPWNDRHKWNNRQNRSRSVHV